MADRNDGAPRMVSREDAAGRAHSTGDRAGAVVAEFIDAARSAAESLLEEQKQQIGERVAGVAEALRSAADSLDRSHNRVIARYVEQASDQVEGLSRTLRERRWNEILTDTEAFARRQPTVFVLGAIAAGFLVGRFLWVPTVGQRYQSDAAAQSSRSPTAGAVTAAVSSGTGADEVAGYGAGPSGALEAR